MEDRPPMQLNYQSLQSRKVRRPYDRAMRGLVIGLFISPVFGVLVYGLCYLVQSPLPGLYLYPVAICAAWASNSPVVGVLGCILQSAIYGWCIGLLLSHPRRWLILLLLTAHG